MSITETLRKALFTPLALFVLVAGAVFVPLAINAHAQSISLEPVSIDRSNPNERGWFLYNVKPGSTIEDTVVVRNATEYDTKVQLSPNDATVTTDGTFSLSANEVPNTQLGSWISLSQDNVSIKGGENIGVKFKITVPQDAKSGEYAGGISATIIDEKATTGIGSKLRLGVRMYLTVDGDLSLNPAIKSPRIVQPNDADFEDRLVSRGSTSPDSMGFYITGTELGNIYSKAEIKATFTLPDGKKETKNFTRNFIPGQPDTEFYLETKLPYQVGDTKVEIEYTAAPFIDNKPNLKKTNESGKLDYTLTMTQDDLTKLNEVYTRLKSVRDNRRQKATQSNATPTNEKPFTIQEGNLAEIQPAKSEGMNPYILYGLIGVIVLLIVALLAVLIKHKKDTEPAKEKTQTQAAKKDKPSIKK